MEKGKNLYPIIKPQRPRTKETPITVTNELDPYDGHLTTQTAFEISVRATYQDWKRFSQYAHNYPGIFLNDFQKKFLQSVVKSGVKTKVKPATKILKSVGEITLKATPRDWWQLAQYIKENPKFFLIDFKHKFLTWLTNFDIVFLMEGYWVANPRGIHTRVAPITSAIRILATKVYCTSKYWIDKEENKWPSSFAKQIQLLKKSDNSFFIFNKQGKYDTLGIAYASILNSTLRNLATDNGIKLIPDNESKNMKIFRESYISEELIKKLDDLFKQSEYSKSYYTDLWLQYLNCLPKDWIKLCTIAR